MGIRTKTCPQCGKSFSYGVGKGTDRLICSSACRKARKAKQDRDRFDAAPACSVEGCEKRRRGKHGLCEMHYSRLRANGDLSRPAPSYRYLTGAGYIKLYDPDHGLSDAKGYVFEHRKVMFDQQGGHCPGCVWCGADLDWASAVVDHLNEDKGDNGPDNLVVSCNDCNRARGAVVPFIRKLSPESFERLIGAFRSLVAQGGGGSNP